MAVSRLHVTAAIVRHEGKILLARRGTGPLAGRWEFPGGKIEPGETPEACLVREIGEELGAEIAVRSFLARSDHDYDGFSIRLDGFLCDWTGGEFRCGADHTEIAWISPGELLGYDLAPADVTLAEAAAAA